MKLITTSRALVTATSLVSILFVSAASAEYRVTALGKAVGYSELLAKDTASAASRLSKRSIGSMDYLELNNLCVTEILLKEFDAAITSCERALGKTELAYDLSARKMRSAKASIYSNMAVAKAFSGDALSAKVDLETALSLNASDSNASRNYETVAATIPASDIAQTSVSR